MKKKPILFLLFLMSLSNNFIAQNSTINTSEIKTPSPIIVYGSDECHHCTDTKAYLKKNNIDYIFFDIDKNSEALKEMLTKLRNAGISTQNLGIPVIDKQGIIYTNTGVFEEFLKKLN